MQLKEFKYGKDREIYTLKFPAMAIQFVTHPDEIIYI